MKIWNEEELSEDLDDFCLDLCSIRACGDGSCCLINNDSCPLFDFKKKVVRNEVNDD